MKEKQFRELMNELFDTDRLFIPDHLIFADWLDMALKNPENEDLWNEEEPDNNHVSDWEQFGMEGTL